MTTIQEEDELFEADLSADFYDFASLGGGSNNRHPWRSDGTGLRSTGAPLPPGGGRSGPRRSDDHDREPYELLDDVPPADIPGNTPTAGITYVRGVGRDDGGYVGRPPNRRSSRTATTAAGGRYSPRPIAVKSAAWEGSRYPIDNDIVSLSSSDEDGGHHSRFSSPAYSQHSAASSSSAPRYSPCLSDGVAGDGATIAESRSDDEVSEYRPLPVVVVDEENHTRQRSEGHTVNGAGGGGRFEYEYDHSSDYSAMSITSDGNLASRASAISFDRLYADEVREMDDLGIVVDSPPTGGYLSGLYADEVREMDDLGIVVDSPPAGGYLSSSGYRTSPRSKAKDGPASVSQVNSLGTITPGSSSAEIGPGSKIPGTPGSSTSTPGSTLSGIIASRAEGSLASESSAYVTPGGNSRPANVKADTQALTPQRSNLGSCRPATPYQKMAGSPEDSTKSTTVVSPIPASAVPPILPGIHGGENYLTSNSHSVIGDIDVSDGSSFGSTKDGDGSTILSMSSSAGAIWPPSSFQKAKGRVEAMATVSSLTYPTEASASGHNVGSGRDGPDHYTPHSLKESPRGGPINNPFVCLPKDSPNNYEDTKFVSPHPEAETFKLLKEPSQDGPDVSHRCGDAKPVDSYYPILNRKQPGWNASRRRDDPPDDDLGYYPQSEEAKEPEGYKQYGLFPDLDLCGGGGRRARLAYIDPPTAAVQETAGGTGGRGTRHRVQQEDQLADGYHYYESDYYKPGCDHRSTDRPKQLDPGGDYDRNGHRTLGGGGHDYFYEAMNEIDDKYQSMHGERKEGAGAISDENHRNHHEDSKRGKASDAIGFKLVDGQLLQEEYRTTTKEWNPTSSGDMPLDSNKDSWSSRESSNGSSHLDGSDIVSTLLDYTERRQLTSRDYHRQQHQQVLAKSTTKQKHSHYEVKQKDSMESDIKIDFDVANKTKTALQSSSWKKEERLQGHHPYKNIKKKDSMEEDMNIIGFEDVDSDNRANHNDVNGGSGHQCGVAIMEEDELPKVHNECSERTRQRLSQSTILSPPTIRRKPFSFGRVREEKEADDSEDDGRYELAYYNDGKAALKQSVHYPPQKTSGSDVPGRNYSSEDDSGDVDNYDDETNEVSEDDPTIFPSTAISRMNPRNHHKEDCGDLHDESKDLVLQACHHLARGRNDEALRILREALRRAGVNVDEAKRKVVDFHSQRSRQANNDILDKLGQDEREDRLNSGLRSAASEMANVLNNIGVVHELEGDYQRAMNSFRDALDVYRNQCNRYENAGDVDVDRTVSNMLQMGIAMKSDVRRRELHREADKLAAESLKWQSSDNTDQRTQLQVKWLNTLMCVLDLEVESLGANHPAVGFTLLKKGGLHLEMKHVDMAIKDILNAISILKRGLGEVHPNVGLALVRLADIFNYNVGYRSGGWDNHSDNKDTALSLYKEALLPLRQSLGLVDPHLGMTHNVIGILHSEKGDAKRAMTSFYKALASYGVRSRAACEASSGEGGRLSSLCPDLFFVWANIGGLHMEARQWRAALRAYVKARSALQSLNNEQRRLLREIGPRRLMRRALASADYRSPFFFEDDDTLLVLVLHNAGKAHSMEGRYGKAIEMLEEALQISRVVVMRGNKRGLLDSTSSARDVARILQNLGEVQMISGDLTSAFDSYVESLDLLRSNENVDDSSVEVALVLGAVGGIHLKRGEYTEARVVLRECIRMFEKIGVPPNNRRINEIRSNLVDSELALVQNATSTLARQSREISSVPVKDRVLAIDEIADACRNCGDHDGAIWFYSEALEIRRSRARQFLSSPSRERDDETVDVGRTICNIAKLRRDRREYGAAKILFEEAKEIYRSVGLSVNHPFFRDVAREMEVMNKM